MSASAPLLEVRGLTRRFGGLTAVDSVDLDVGEGEFVSIIGPNGAGKTTLFNLVTGLDDPDAGTVRLEGHDITRAAPERLATLGIARTFQHGRVFANLSVLDNVLVGSHVRFKKVRPSWSGPLWLLEPFAELALALIRPSSVGAEEKRMREEALAILARFGDRLTPRKDNPAYSLSYANRRRVEIARALALGPRLLLLDEPTAGMNPQETRAAEELVFAIRDRGIAVLGIEQDMRFIFNLCDRVAVLVQGEKLVEGDAETVQNDERVVAAYLGTPFEGAPGQEELAEIQAAEAAAEADADTAGGASATTKEDDR
jgi:branched-chain amino acid transport system ATP-binding protein